MTIYMTYFNAKDGEADWTPSPGLIHEISGLLADFRYIEGAGWVGVNDDTLENGRPDEMGVAHKFRHIMYNTLEDKGNLMSWWALVNVHGRNDWVTDSQRVRLDTVIEEGK